MPLEPYFQRDGITLYHADCRDVLPTIEAGSVDLVLTDPPYGINLGNHSSAKDGRKDHVLAKQAYDLYEDTEENFRDIVVPILKKCITLADRSAIFIASKGAWLLPPPDATGGIYLPSAQGRNRWGFSSFIPLLLYGSAPDLNLGSKATAIRSTESCDKNGHPCPKPIGWIKWAVSLASREGETILDPFAGSGTTLRAAMDLGRKAIGIEISEKYCEIAARRLEQRNLQFAESL